MIMGEFEGNPGDRIKVIFPSEEYEGILLECPESERGIVMLKLDSGYNIGFIKKDILDVELTGKVKEKKIEIDFKKDKDKPNVAMILTGGTIASKVNPKTGGVEPLDTPESLFTYYPNIFKKVNVIKAEVPFMKASEDMDFKDWRILAEKTEELLNNSNIKGVIITHGTDFLHYTSAALSFFLKNLNKPVVLTYSQRSIDRASSDAYLNLECSALAAISDIAEVMIVGHATQNDDYCFALPGIKVRKMHTTRRDTFRVLNGKPLAKIDENKIEILSEHKKRNKNIVEKDIRFEDKVALIKIYPGQEPDILDYYLDKNYKGIVLELAGLGHVPSRGARKSWIKKLKQVQEKGMIVCGVAQTLGGRLNPYVYSNGRELMDTGVIFLEDMLPETALVKLGWVLGHKNWIKTKDLIKETMLHNFSGEISGRLED